jgi:hypothetical protein
VKHASAYRTFLALVASLAWSSALLAEQNVTFSTDVNFTIRPSASGIVSRSRDSLSLLLYDVTLVSQDPTSATPRSFRVGIAFGDPSTGRWNVSHWSPHIDINAPFDLTGTLEVKPVRCATTAALIPSAFFSTNCSMIRSGGWPVFTANSTVGLRGIRSCWRYWSAPVPPCWDWRSR